jgi:hypothetical protein
MYEPYGVHLLSRKFVYVCMYVCMCDVLIIFFVQSFDITSSYRSYCSYCRVYVCACHWCCLSLRVWVIAATMAVLVSVVLLVVLIILLVVVLFEAIRAHWVYGVGDQDKDTRPFHETEIASLIPKFYYNNIFIYLWAIHNYCYLNYYNILKYKYLVLTINFDTVSPQVHYFVHYYFSNCKKRISVVTTISCCWLHIANHH